ncbi:MAG: hydrolase [bacterium]
MSKTSEKSECCPKFEPAPWDGKVLQWKNKKFIKDSVRTLFYIPLNFGKVMKRMNAAVEKSGAKIPDWLSLSEYTSKWNMDLYLAVDKDVFNAKNTQITGTFLSKVYEGEFKQTGKWLEEFDSYAKEKGHTLKKKFLWYTTCPKCAKKYGKNYVVVVGEV